jgi:hypothetical protein
VQIGGARGGTVDVIAGAIKVMREGLLGDGPPEVARGLPTTMFTRTPRPWPDLGAGRAVSVEGGGLAPITVDAVDAAVVDVGIGAPARHTVGGGSQASPADRLLREGPLLVRK